MTESIRRLNLNPYHSEASYPQLATHSDLRQTDRLDNKR